MTTVKQALNRMNDGHFKLLQVIAGERPSNPLATVGEIRGMRICYDTLSRWQALDHDGLTDFGRELLDAAKERFAARKPFDPFKQGDDS